MATSLLTFKLLFLPFKLTTQASNLKLLQQTELPTLLDIDIKLPIRRCRYDFELTTINDKL